MTKRALHRCLVWGTAGGMWLFLSGVWVFSEDGRIDGPEPWPLLAVGVVLGALSQAGLALSPWAGGRGPLVRVGVALLMAPAFAALAAGTVTEFQTDWPEALLPLLVLAVYAIQFWRLAGLTPPRVQPLAHR